MFECLVFFIHLDGPDLIHLNQVIIHEVLSGALLRVVFGGSSCRLVLGSLGAAQSGV